MQRRKFIETAILLPASVIGTSCERKEFSSATVITGKVVDTNDKGIRGFSLRLTGEESGLGARSTFSAEAVTDESGQYSISQPIPKHTDLIILIVVGTDIIKPGAFESDYNGFYMIDDRPQPLTDPIVDILRDRWGATFTINFRFEKK